VDVKTPSGHAPLDARARRRRRARPVIALAAVAFVLGAIFGSGHSAPSAADALAARFVSAWAHGDYATMYAQIDAASRQRLSPDEFATAYAQADTAATATRLRVAGRPREAHGAAAAAGTGDAGGGRGAAGTDAVVIVPVRVQTRLFGTLAESFTLPIAGSGAAARIVWSHTLVFPGLHAGEQLRSDTTLPTRAALLARDGSVLAAGAALAAGQRDSPLGALAGAVVGEVGPIPTARRAQLEAQGVPADAIVGASGLEAALDDRLRGTPGGRLLAGERVLANATPHAAPALRTTISPSVQRAAVAALGGRYGGIVALDPASGQILAVAGIGLNDLQPPGSTFKMITLTAALQYRVAHTSTVFPYATAATLDGVKLSNANGEDCGGTLALAFAVSCNSVFAPLGVRVGAARLVATAERFGFNHDPGIAGAAESTLPPASQIQGELDVGSTAIGQGEVQASALQMAIVAATIADEGRRPQATFTPDPGDVARQGGEAGQEGSEAGQGDGAGQSGRAGQGGRATRIAAVATSAAVARTVRRLMIGVVREGTGTAAAIAGVTVAGKTGTAELGEPKSCEAKSSEAGSGESKAGEAGAGSGSGAASQSECLPANDPRNTDAWFAAFAPALHPRIAVGVLMVRDGAGGDTAAPVARQVLEAGLQARG
jgi:hypothetical protein